MDISTFLTLTIMTVIITFVFTQILDNKEKLYLDATTPLTKKLMVVDQTTGAISFLNDNVKQIDDKFAASDTTQLDHLKSLFGPDLDGTAGVFNEKMTAAIKVVADRVEAVDTALDGRITTLETSVIKTGQKIVLGREGDNGCGGHGCRAVTGFKQVDRDPGKEDGGWKKLDANFNHGSRSAILIWKV